MTGLSSEVVQGAFLAHAIRMIPSAFIGWRKRIRPVILLVSRTFSGVEIRMEMHTYVVEMDGNGEQFVKMFWIGLDFGQGHQLEAIR